MSVQQFDPAVAVDKTLSEDSARYTWKINLDALPGPGSHLAKMKRFSSEGQEHLLWVDGTKIFDLPEEMAQWIDDAIAQQGSSAELNAFIADLESQFGASIGTQPAQAENIRAISLNIAQHCNLGCKYCYADEGKFGGNSQVMTEEVAKAAVDKLIAENQQSSNPHRDIIIGFMGGEPLINRKLLRSITTYAIEKSRVANLKAKFSVTTNATLLNEADAKWFHQHQFQVTVSVDGPKELNDALRPARGELSSYDQLCQGLKWLKAYPPGHLSGRITVTPQMTDLLPILQHVIAMGFDDVGFAPVLVSPAPDYAFSKGDFQQFLSQMILCGEYAKSQLMQNKRFPFSNFETALNELHRGSHRPYPCGAGAGYVSVSAKGDIYACHRLIDDEKWHLGDTQQGLDLERRQAILNRKFVDKQPGCQSCWARYLCGGGCYHEVEQRGRPGCDYIKGWLTFCLQTYATLSASHPDYFVTPEQFFNQPNITQAQFL